MSNPAKSGYSAPSRTTRSLRAPNIKNPFSRHNANRQSANLEKCTLMMIPLELRNMVYDLTLPEEWDGKTPEIIAALRQFGVLYDEVMKAFRKKNYIFKLSAGNGWSFGDMNPKIVDAIESVKLVVDEGIALHPAVAWNGLIILQHPNLNNFCLRELEENCAVAKNVKSVIVECICTHEALWQWHNVHFTNYLAGFSNLTKVTASIPLHPTSTPIANPDEELVFGDKDEHIALLGFKTKNDVLGVEYKIVKRVPDVFDDKGNMVSIRFADRYRFVWEAQAGETLKKVDLAKMFLH